VAKDGLEEKRGVFFAKNRKKGDEAQRDSGQKRTLEKKLGRGKVTIEGGSSAVASRGIVAGKKRGHLEKGANSEEDLKKEKHLAQGRRGQLGSAGKKNRD